MTETKSHIERNSDDKGTYYPYAGIHGRVVHEIGREIVSGVLNPGERLPKEEEIIERFQGSRTAIREAMRVLAAKGLVEARQRSGTRVRPVSEWNILDPDVMAWQDPANFSKDMLRQLIEMRVLIEPQAARFTAERASDEALKEIRIQYDLMQKAEDENDIKNFYKADLAFHLAIFRACGNRYVIALSSVVEAILNFSFRLQQKKAEQVSASGARAHWSLLEKIEQRDASGAELAMQAIIARAKDELEL
jgi:GntR family transcriptional regulator, galactonate operon transcriptional repressor